MASQVEDLTVDYSEEGVQLVKELDKAILSKGAWATVIFRYKDFDKQKQEFGPDKYVIRRYQKRGGVYQQKSKFNISSADQAKSIVAALSKWIDAADRDESK